MKYLFKFSLRTVVLFIRPSSALLLASVVWCLAAIFAAAAAAVIPASLTFNSLRDEAMVYPTDASFFEGTTLLLTNCVMFSGTSTNSARQGLSEVTIQVKVGNAAASTAYAGAAQVATNGTWFCLAAVPTNSGQCYVQVKITDAITNSYIYPWKILNHKPPL